MSTAKTKNTSHRKLLWYISLQNNDVHLGFVHVVDICITSRGYSTKFSLANYIKPLFIGLANPVSEKTCFTVIDHKKHFCSHSTRWVFRDSSSCASSVLHFNTVIKTSLLFRPLVSWSMNGENNISIYPRDTPMR